MQISMVHFLLSSKNAQNTGTHTTFLLYLSFLSLSLFLLLSFAIPEDWFNALISVSLRTFQGQSSMI